MARLATVTILVGCYQPTFVTGSPCTANGACPNGQQCELSASPPICVDMLGDAGQQGAVLVGQSASSMVSALTVSTTFSPPPIAGNTLVLVGGSSTSIATVGGGGVATWARAVATYSNKDIEIWWGVTDGSTPTVTLTSGSMANNLRISVSEWSGLGALDQVGHASGTSAPATAGVMTTGAADLLIFAAADAAPTTYGAPTPGAWTELSDANDSVTDQSEWYQAVSSAGSYSPAVSQTGDKWDAAVAAFLITGG
jgi:hypothetical protein